MYHFTLSVSDRFSSFIFILIRTYGPSCPSDVPAWRRRQQYLGFREVSGALLRSESEPPKLLLLSRQVFATFYDLPVLSGSVAADDSAAAATSLAASVLLPGAVDAQAPAAPPSNHGDALGVFSRWSLRVAADT